MKKIQLTMLLGLVLVFALVGTVLVVRGKGISPPGRNDNQGAVLAAHDETDANAFATDVHFEVNIPAVFNDTVRFTGESSFENLTTTSLVTSTLETSTLVVASEITAPNILYSLIGSDGLAIVGDQDLTISNTDKGSSQNIFKNFKVGSDTASAGSNTDAFEFVAGTNIGLSLDTGAKKLTINNTFSMPSQPWTLTGTNVHLTTDTDFVGIGTTAPSYKLQVAGSTGLSGDVVLGGAITDELTFTARMASGTTLVPIVDLGADLGSSSLRFNNIYAATINTNSTLSTAGQAVFTYEPTSTAYTQASVLINPTAPSANTQLLGIGQGGYQRMLVDAEGDLTLGYNDAVSAPTTDYPLNIYGHNGTRVAHVDTSGNGYFAGNLDVGGSFSTPYAQTITVAKSGGDYTSIATAYTYAKTLTPSATNRILIKVMPGEYTEAITLDTDYISLDGSGADTTTITYGASDTVSVTANVSAVTVSNFKITNSSTNNTIQFSTTTNPEFRDNKLTGSGFTVAIANGISGGYFRRNTFTYEGAATGVIGVAATGGTFENNSFILTNGFAHLTVSLSGVTFRNNFINTNYNSTVTSGTFNGNHWIAVNNPAIAGGTWVNNRLEWTRSDQTNGISGGTFIGNHITSSITWNGIKISGGSPEFSGGIIDSGVNITVNTASPKFTNVKMGATGITATQASTNVYLSGVTTEAALSANLIVNGSSNTLLSTLAKSTIYDNSASTALNIYQSGAGDLLNVFDGATEVFTILDGGNVGIGTTAPSSKLAISQGTSNINDTTYGLKVLTDAYNSTGRNVRFADLGESYYLDIGGFEGALLRYNSNVAHRFALGGVDTVYLGSTTVDGGLTYSSLTSVPQTTSTVGLLVQGRASQTADLVNVQNSAFTKLYVIDSAGNVGIGTTTPGAKLHEVSNLTASSAKGTYLQNTITGGTDNFYGVYNSLDYNTASYINGVTGNYTFIDNNISGRMSLNTSAYRATIRNQNAAVPITSSQMFTGQYVMYDGSDITSAMYYQAQAPYLSSGSVISTLYGLYIDDFSGNSGTNYGIYQAGATDKNYFAGNVGIGTTTSTSPLHLVKSVTGSNTSFYSTTAITGSTASIINKGAYIEIDNSNTLNNTTQTAYEALILNRASSGSNYSRAFYGTIQTHPPGGANGHINNAFGGDISFNIDGDIDVGYGYNVNTAGSTGTIDNFYGYYVGDITNGTNTNTPFGFYSSDANAYNYFAGNVGIGTTTNLSAKLTVHGTVGTTSEGDIFSQYDGGSATWYPIIARYWDANGTYPASTYIFGNGTNARVGIEKPGGSDVSHLQVKATKATFNNRIGIANTDPQVALHVGGTGVTDGTSLLRLEDANSTCDFTADAGSPSCGSDLTLKKDIASLDTVDLLTRISNLNPVSYRWNSQDSSAAPQFGFIAQEVEAQFPDLVKMGTWVDGTQRKFLNTGGLMPYVIGAVKEQSKLITALQAQTTVQAQVDDNGDLTTLEDRLQVTEDKNNEQDTEISNLKSVIGNLFKNTVEFIADVTFKGQLFFNPNQTGTIVIPAGSTAAKITFKKTLPQLPIVNATPQESLTGQVTIKDVTPDSFTIELTQTQDHQMTINWLATLKDTANTEGPTVEILGTSSEASPTPEVSPLPSPELEESPVASESSNSLSL